MSRGKRLIPCDLICQVVKTHSNFESHALHEVEPDPTSLHLIPVWGSRGLEFIPAGRPSITGLTYKQRWWWHLLEQRKHKERSSGTVLVVIKWPLVLLALLPQLFCKMYWDLGKMATGNQKANTTESGLKPLVSESTFSLLSPCSSAQITGSTCCSAVCCKEMWRWFFPKLKKVQGTTVSSSGKNRF